MNREGVYPIIGDWYRMPYGQIFEVVAIDNDDHTVEIQYFDGAIGELDIDIWYELQISCAEPPEDWSGSLDITREDYGVDLDLHHETEWQNPLDHYSYK